MIRDFFEILFNQHLCSEQLIKFNKQIICAICRMVCYKMYVKRLIKIVWKTAYYYLLKLLYKYAPVYFSDTFYAYNRINYA